MTLSVTACSFLPERYREYEALSRSVKYGVNLHPIWLATYLAAFGCTDLELMLEVRDEAGTLQGMLPLVRKDSRETRFLTHRRLVPLGYGPSDFFGIPSAPGFEETVTGALATWLERNAGTWDRITLNLIPEGCAAPLRLATQLRKAGFRVDVSEDQPYLAIDTRGSFEAYLAGLGSAKRRYLRQHRARLGDRMRVEHLTRNTAQHFDSFLETYRGRRSAMTQSDPYTRMPALDRFFRAIIPQFEAEDSLLLSRLFLDDQAIACCYCLKHGEVLYYYMPAIDDAHAEYAPGMLLLLEIIERAFQSGSIAEFNFGRSDQPYKRWFKPEPVACRTVTIDNERSVRTKALSVVNAIRRHAVAIAPESL